MSEDIIEIIEKYSKEYGMDTILDETRLREIELKIPGIKGKWASYKAVNKAKLFKLKKDRDRLLSDGVEIVYKERSESGNPVSKHGAEKILRNTQKFQVIAQDIERLTILCEYFEDTLKNIQSIGFDVKNLVETIKIDEL